MDRTAVTVGPGMDVPIMHDSDRYELVKDIGFGNFGVARLMRDRQTNELVAVKYIERGEKIDENVKREIINHRSLRHPNIVRFKEVILTPTHLAIVMEYASGGELFERICNAGRFSEDEARFFFQQLIPGVSYCHAMHVCHRDLKLENTLLDGSPAPRLKICDFGYSKSSVLHSQPKSTVGTPAYIAPELLLKKEYDGKIADVWSCGVTLYVMLVGAYPFEDPEEPKNFRKTIQRILNVQYSIPDYVHISPECRHLISRIFVADPAKRISIPEIKNHEWFLRNLPADLMDNTTNNQFEEPDQRMQSIDEIMQIITEATIPATGTDSLNHYLTGSLDIDDDMEEDLESDPDLDIDSSGEIVYAMVLQNHYKHAFLQEKSISEASHRVPEVVETIKSSVERLINEVGAKTVMISGILLMGCFPCYHTLFPEGDSIGKNRCHRGLNIFSRLHNNHLWQAVLELRLKYPDVDIIYVDYYKAFMVILKNHTFLGSKTKTLMKACCGSGDSPFNFDVKKMCGEEGAAMCSERASYVHWDGFQLTAEALENVIDTLFSKKGFLFPEFKFGQETTEAITRHHSKIHGGVGVQLFKVTSSAKNDSYFQN
ncbi:hypothetical protein K7X08_008835 [Anisodus acutangulus]|uniref:non-specific serine/threonine protein kinase n=1 Tax=Anisodus acutangulus TaxID=402998 RepID=A0A9Q1MYC1_9SOLA|nr:hypothetical protein K7X08_008835 [Anisodus acutangulus]